MKIRTLIVDDEPLARDGVAMALDEVEDVEIVGHCSDGRSAVRSIRRLAPDLVFLDIRMPGLDGFEVIEAVGPERMPAVIFLTAYEEHALRAFRVNAVDYLLKPVEAGELRESLDRARSRLAEADAEGFRDRLRGLLDSVEHAARQSPVPERIVVRAGGRVHLLDPGEIVWVEASGDYVTVHTADKAHLVRDSMRGMESRLADYGFQRIHRSALVKRSAIREIVTSDSGDGRVRLGDGTSLKFSRTYRNALLESLNAGS